MVRALAVALLAGSVCAGFAQAPATTRARRVADFAGPYLGVFYPVDPPPQPLLDVRWVIVQELTAEQDEYPDLMVADEHGEIRVRGRLVLRDSREYPFARAVLVEGEKAINLRFQTVSLEGVSYRFGGTYAATYQGTEIRDARGDRLWVVLEGTLTRITAGWDGATERLKLGHWAEE